MERGGAVERTFIILYLTNNRYDYLVYEINIKKMGECFCSTFFFTSTKGEEIMIIKALKSIVEGTQIGRFPTFLALLALFYSIIQFITDIIKFVTEKTSISEKLYDMKKRALRMITVDDVFKKWSIAPTMLISSFLLFFLGWIAIDVRIGNKQLEDIMQNSIVDTTNLMLMLASIAIMVSLSLNIFEKKYCLFSVNTILNMYNTRLWIGLTLFTSVATYICRILMQTGQIRELYIIVIFLIFQCLIIYNIIAVSMIFYISMRTVFSQKNKERKMLSQLHKIIWINWLDVNCFAPKNKWSENAIYYNLMYLLKKYLKKAKKIKTDRINNIKYVSNIEDNLEYYYKNYSREFWMKVMSFLLIISILANFVEYNSVFNRANSINMIAGVGFLFILKKNIKCLEKVCIIFSIDYHGYIIKWDNNKKERFASIVSLKIKSKYEKYMDIMNSLIVFLYIELELSLKDELINKSIIIIEKELNKDNKNSLPLYFPVLFFGYLSFLNGKEVEEIKKIYIKIGKSKENRKMLKEFVDSQEKYMKKNLYNLKNKKNMTEEYLSWLEG